MCPKCGASCILDCKDYKIELNNCRNKHKEVMNIYLKKLKKMNYLICEIIKLFLVISIYFFLYILF